jgi:hypothetical protein
MNKIIRISWMSVLVGALCLGLVLTSACKKKSPAEEAMSIAESLAKNITPNNVQNDYTKPYLTEEKMAKFIESLQEEMNPFDVVFKGGQTQNLTDLKDKMEAFNAYAKKYGFNDYYDYMAVWGRITVGEMMIGAKDMLKGTTEWLQKSITEAEENLKKPDLSPEMKTAYEEQIASGKKSLEDMNKPDTSGSQLNESDIALVAKYKAQIEEATKKFKENRDQK